ncbi:hypothetical protein NE237_016854 [Protea cynaroides]|uniref:Uncharacterized protein n=1 Tax=Protea cynaroides TaxID=273540 RepID=A0A9Q0HHY6_9MAGN|nr:hypothetical protein NE237_016854 [Protea cynaroides]
MHVFLEEEFMLVVSNHSSEGSSSSSSSATQDQVFRRLPRTPLQPSFSVAVGRGFVGGEGAMEGQIIPEKGPLEIGEMGASRVAEGVGWGLWRLERGLDDTSKKF